MSETYYSLQIIFLGLCSFCMFQLDIQFFIIISSQILLGTKVILQGLLNMQLSEPYSRLFGITQSWAQEPALLMRTSAPPGNNRSFANMVLESVWCSNHLLEAWLILSFVKGEHDIHSCYWCSQIRGFTLRHKDIVRVLC